MRFRMMYVVLLSMLWCSVLAADGKNLYTNQTVGFAVSKPAEWRFVTAAQNLENLKRVQFGTAEFKDVIVKYSTAPLVVMMKYDEPYDGLNPSFKANIKSFGAMPEHTGKAVLDLVIPQLLKQFADAQIAQVPGETTVDGYAATHAIINYTLKSAEGGEFPTTSELWIVPDGDYFFMMGAGYLQDDPAQHAEIQQILSGIELGSADDRGE